MTSLLVDKSIKTETKDSKLGTNSSETSVVFEFFRPKNNSIDNKVVENIRSSFMPLIERVFSIGFESN